MDFGSLLHVAQQNSKNEIKKPAEGKYYSTKFAPPKKESKDKKLSSNIQKFLAKRDEEEREKARLAKEKRDQLLSMRDVKAKNKINKMLKVIKSANKSVLDDVDQDHTAVTIGGPEQPDEDDYGYVSQEASALYSKLMEKYKSMPEEKKFNGSGKALSKEEMRNTKDRVRAAIAKETEEEQQPHQRQRKSHPKPPAELSFDNRKGTAIPGKVVEEARTEEKPKPKAPKRPPPPALDFQTLLKLAEKKQFEPIQLEVSKPKEQERLLTSKEKREMEEKRAYFEAKERRQKEREYKLANPGAPDPKTPQPKTAPVKMEPNGRIPKLNNGSAVKSVNNRPAQQPIKSVTPSDKKNVTPSSSKLYSALTKSELNKPLASKPASSSSLSGSNHKESLKSSIASRPPTVQGSRSVDKSFSSPSTSKTISEQRPKAKPSSSSGSNSRDLPSKEASRRPPPQNVDVKSRQAPSAADVKPRQNPTSDIKSRQFPPADIRPRQMPLQRDRGTEQKKKVAQKRRILDDDDSEYDSEMDDFIDDGEEDQDYSKYISEIFGYDKRRYRDEAFDDREMESSYAQQMREEFISKKIGLMEDLEDMRQEAEEKKRKSQMKKKR